MPTCPRKTERERGFTLIEMLVVLTVIGLVAAVLAVRLRSEPGSFQRNRAALALENAIAAGRDEARARGADVVITPSQVAPGASIEEPVLQGGGPGVLIIYPDGSTSGASIALAGAPLLDVDWLTGKVSRHE